MEFFVLTDEQRKKISLFEIKSDSLAFDPPDTHTLCSLKLGPRKRGEICLTCRAPVCSHPHFAHIQLPIPVLLGYFATALQRDLKRICLICKQTDKSCEPRCKYPSKVKIARGICQLDGREYTLQEIHSLVCGESSSSTWETTHPKHYFIQTVVVVGNSLRPMNAEAKTNPYTREYQMLIRACHAHRMGKDMSDRISYIVNDMLYKSLTPAQMQARKYMPLLNTIKAKEGLIRGTIIGKTVIYCARTTVAGNPTLRPDQCGIPAVICDNMTTQEVIFPGNLARIRGLADKNRLKCIYTKDGAKFMAIPGEVFKSRIQIGCKVERYMETGDPVILNRQPTLHISGMMGFSLVRVNGIGSIQIHPSVNHPFNADYDGDEFNVHFPQTYSTKSEVEHVMTVRERVVGDNGVNQIGLVQDALMGIYRLSQSGALLDYGDFCQLTYQAPTECASVFTKEGGGVELWTGIQAIRTITDEYRFINIDKELFDSNGVLIRGPLTKKHLGPSGTMIRLVWCENKKKSIDFIQRMNELGEMYLGMVGLSIGMSACSLKSPRAETMLQEGLEECGTDVVKFQTVLGKVRKEYEIALTNQPDNPFLGMGEAGAKGSIFNYVMIVGFVGEQYVNGKPLPKALGDRMMAHMSPRDKTMKSMGFVQGNLLNGLNAIECALTQAVGRDNIINRSVGTQKDGVVNNLWVRRFIDYTVSMDYTVTDGEGKICQFLFGDDGVDPRYSFALRGTGYEYTRNGVCLQMKQNPDRMLVDPGTAIGVQTANSICSRLTQSTLDSMHRTSAVTNRKNNPRKLKELTSFKTKIVDKVLTLNVPDARVVVNYLSRRVPLDMYIEDIYASLPWWCDLFDQTFPQQEQHIKYDKLLVLEFDRDVCSDSIDLIHHVMEDGRFARASPRKFGERIIVHLGLQEDEDEMDVASKYYGGQSWIQGIHFVNVNTVEIETTKSLPWLFWYFKRYVDSEFRFSDIQQVAKYCGIEKAREVLYREFLALDTIFGDVNSRQISFVCDCTTYLGWLVGVSGNNETQSAFTRSTARDPVRQLAGAASRMEFDANTGTFSRMAMGDVLKVGTRAPFDVIEDKMEMESLVRKEEERIREEKLQEEKRRAEALLKEMERLQRIQDDMEYVPLDDDEYGPVEALSPKYYSPGAAMSPLDVTRQIYSPSSPFYSPCSPCYSPSSPCYSPKQTSKRLRFSG